MVNGKEQLDGVNVAGGRGGADHCAEITEFMHTAQYDYLKGDASQGYDPEDVTSFTREVIFVRPDYFILFDQVLATKPSRFDWHLHTLGQMIVEGDTISVRQDEAAVAVKMLVPAAFEHEVLHTSCPIAGNPPPMIDDTYLKLWPAEQSDSANFLTVLFPQPVEEGQEPVCPSVKTINADGLLGALIEDGEVRDIALFALGDEPIEFEDISTDAARCFVRFKQGHPSQFAVHHATFLQVGEHRVFESPGAISEARLLSERGSDL